MERIAAKSLSPIKAYYREVLIFLFFIALSCFFTYPLVLDLGRSVYGGGGDALNAIWHFWWLKFSYLKGVSSDFCPLIGSPFGVDYAGSVKYLLWQAVTLPLVRLLGEIFTFNLFIFISFPLAAVSMYFLTYYLTRRRLASALSGTIFAFSPYHLAHAEAHLTLAQVQWIPLYILSLFMLWEKRSYPRAILSGLALALVLLTDYYYGFFMIVFTVLFLLFKAERYYSDRERPDFRAIDFLKTSGVFLLSVLLPLLPFLVPVLKSIASSPALYARPAADLRIYAARPWQYLLPSVENPIAGKFLRSFIDSHLYGSNTIEQTLYLGVIPLLLAGWALIFRGKIKVQNGLSKLDTRRFVLPFFSFLAVASILLSAPAFISLGEFKMAFPSYFLYKIAPMFRCYARFGLLVLLSVSVVAAVGFADLEDMIGGHRRRMYLFSAVTLLLLVEFANFPPFRTINVATVPEVYKWLSGQPQNCIIAEFPFVGGEDGIQSKYQFFQRVHQKRMANGALPGTPGDVLRSSLVDISNPSVSGMLNYLGVRYVIIHKHVYREEFGRIPKPARNGLLLKKDFGNDAVYEVKSSKPAVLIFYKNNFYPADYWEDGSTWNWMSNEGKLIVENRTKKEIKANISSPYVVSVGRERDLEVFLNGSRVEVLKGLAVKPLTLRIERIRLKPGKNVLEFLTPQDARPLNDTFNNYDSREVSLGFRSFRITTEK